MTTTKIWIPAIFVAVLLVTGCQDKVLPGTADMPADPPVSGMPLDDPLPAPGGTGPDSASPDGRPDEDGKNDKFRQDPIEVSEADRPADESGSPTAHPRSAAENDALLPSEESEATDPGSPAPGKASGQEASEPADSESEQAETPSEADAAFRLMNLYIGQPLDEVAGRFPEPSLRYSMPNEEGTLTVLEYDGFMVGYDAADQIEFINIYSEKVNPGLNGVRVGSPADQVAEKLGEPDDRSDYVINYYSENEVLKIDLDPETKQILSIKLFSRT